MLVRFQLIIPGKDVLIVNLNICKNFISDIQAKRFHFLISSRNSNSVHQYPFTIATNIFICLSQVSS